jgi:hypothetical protein
MVERDAEDPPEWAEACRREAAIRDLLNRYPKRLKSTAVQGWRAMGPEKVRGDPRRMPVRPREFSFIAA